MNIEIWSLGKESDAFVKEGIGYYLKRLIPYCKAEFILLPPPHRNSQTQPEQSKLLEEKIILSRLDKQKHYMILMDERGTVLSSKSWAAEISLLQNQSTKTLVLLIGGPWGVTDNVKKSAQKIWSLSKLTFPHQLVRLILAEQLYRCFSILNNSGYHHE